MRPLDVAIRLRYRGYNTSYKWRNIIAIYGNFNYKYSNIVVSIVPNSFVSNEFFLQSFLAGGSLWVTFGRKCFSLVTYGRGGPLSVTYDIDLFKVVDVKKEFTIVCSSVCSHAFTLFPGNTFVPSNVFGIYFKIPPLRRGGTSAQKIKEIWTENRKAPTWGHCAEVRL